MWVGRRSSRSGKTKWKLEDRRSSWAGDFAFLRTVFPLWRQRWGKLDVLSVLLRAQMAARENCFCYNDCSHSVNEEEGRGRAQALWRIAASQFSTVYCRSAGFADWHLDAVHCATLARL